MPTIEKGATNTTIVAAGWSNPNNAYNFDNSYASTSTDNAEQSYTGYNVEIGGSNKIDKVFAKIEHYINIAKNAAGDSHEVTCTLRVYDGSSWQNYQISNLVYSNATPLTDEQPTITVGGDSQVTTYIDVSAFLNTHEKLLNVQTALLFDVTTAGAGCTATWYVDAVTILVCYSPGMAGVANLAVTSKTYPEKAEKALHTVEQALKTLSS